MGESGKKTLERDLGGEWRLARERSLCEGQCGWDMV